MRLNKLPLRLNQIKLVLIVGSKLDLFQTEHRVRSKLLGQRNFNKMNQTVRTTHEMIDVCFIRCACLK